MSKPKIAIVGASGFVGSALCERLFFDDTFEPVPVLHAAARCARLARFPIRFQIADVLDQEQLVAALTGCDYVVNCSRGGSAMMIKGLKHLIKAAQRAGAAGFIHLGSASIYGDLMHGGIIDETAAPRPENPYAVLKLAQDKIVLDSHGKLRCLVLCPPTIYGPYSSFIDGLSRAIRTGSVPLVSGPARMINLIHVDNLVEAILSAIRSSGGWGQRYLVNESEQISWADFFRKIGSTLHCTFEFASVSENYVQLQRSGSQIGRSNPLKTIVSGEFRRSLAQFSLFNRLNNSLYEWFTGTSPRFQKQLRRYLERPVSIRKQTKQAKFDPGLIIVQRDVYYSPLKLIKAFGYRPILTFEEQLQTLANWFDFAGMTQKTEAGELHLQL